MDDLEEWAWLFLEHPFYVLRWLYRNHLSFPVSFVSYRKEGIDLLHFSTYLARHHTLYALVRLKTRCFRICILVSDWYASIELQDQSDESMLRTHIMLFKVPIMLCSDSERQANYAHHFVPIMFTIALIHDNLLGNLLFMIALTTYMSVISTDKLRLH